MEGLSIIEAGKFHSWDQRLANLESCVLELLKIVKSQLPTLPQSDLPGFIAIEDAVKKYKISRVTINNKIKAFKKAKKRDIDRMQSGYHFLINEAELQEAIRIKGHYIPK